VHATAGPFQFDLKNADIQADAVVNVSVGYEIITNQTYINSASSCSSRSPSRSLSLSAYARGSINATLPIQVMGDLGEGATVFIILDMAKFLKSERGALNISCPDCKNLANLWLPSQQSPVMKILLTNPAVFIESLDWSLGNYISRFIPRVPLTSSLDGHR
jgi:hypothetical protein